MQYLEYDKTKIVWEGESPINKTFLIAPIGPKSPVMIFNNKGNLLLKRSTEGFPSQFMQLTDLSGYSYFSGNFYLGPDSKNLTGYAANGRYTIGKLYITDNNLNIKKIIDYIPTSKIPKIIGMQMHGNYVLGDDHYLLQGISFEEVLIDNRNSYVVNCTIQEQLNGRVIWEWQSIDYPELFKASFTRNNYFTPKIISKKCACDYAHMNSCIFTSNKKYVYISFKHIGIVKVDYKTKKIIWILGKATFKQWSLPRNIKLFGHQHDLHLIDDDTIYFWDNKNVSYTELKVADYKVIDYKVFNLSNYRKNMSVMGNALKVSENILDICWGSSLFSLLKGSPDPIISEFDLCTGRKLLDLTIKDHSVELINSIYQVHRGVNIYED